jgi:hypothetical protein
MKVRQRARQAARTHYKLTETAYLLRSPVNTTHLERSIARLRAEGKASKKPKLTDLLSLCDSSAPYVGEVWPDMQPVGREVW